MENDLFTSSSWWQTMETLPIPTDLFYDPHSTPLDQQRLQFRSVPSSMTSSPAASESNNISGDTLMIGKSGKTVESTTNTNSTPLNSAAKSNPASATALTSAEAEETPMKRSGESKSSRKRKAAVPKEKVKGLEACQDYIHVRARRGEATDSHSLAERVRREKIGERMQLLQDLVPGCDKVTGKAVMLDEIINYVQSLQFQVEFLSMKLATVDNDRAQSSNTDDIAMFQLSNISPIRNQHLDFSAAAQSIVGATFPTNCVGAIFRRL